MGDLTPREIKEIAAEISRELGFELQIRIVHLTEKQKQEICQKYEKGEKQKDLAQEYGVRQSAIGALLGRRGTKQTRSKRKGRKLSAEQAKEVYIRYQNGESAYELAKVFGVQELSISYYLAHQGIPRRGNKYKFDQNFFEDIDSEIKAYWLGFVAGDGCVSNSGVLSVSLGKLDVEHLEKFREALKSEHPLRYQTNNSPKSKGYKISIMVSLGIGSEKMSKDLQKHGVTPRKTFTLQWPSSLPDSLLSHYTRGFMDADGGFYGGAYDARSPRTPNVTFAITSARIFLEGMQKYLVKSCDLNLTKLYWHKSYDARTAVLAYTGRIQVARIFSLLYDKATIWLGRKREKAEHLLFRS